MIRDEYEISLWKTSLAEEGDEYYKEEKVVTIGTHEMETPFMAFSPILTEDITGTHEFQFQIYYTVPSGLNYDIFDEYLLGGKSQETSQTTIDNPFAHLILPESKIKLKWKKTWYDFVVKEVTRNKENKTLTYKCIDSYVNELSRTGYNLTFDMELKNNVGTAQELIEEVLKDTTYTFDSTNSDVLREWVEEPVYEGNVVKNITLVDDFLDSHTIDQESKVLVYFPQLKELRDSSESSGSLSLQFGYAKDYIKEPFSLLVEKVFPFTVETSWQKVGNIISFMRVGESTDFMRLDIDAGASGDYRAKRLVKTQLSQHDPLSGYHVDIFRAVTDGEGYKKEDIIYKYKKSIFSSPQTVPNLIVNGKNFSNSTGWSGKEIKFSIYPLFTSSTAGPLDEFESHSYLGFSSNEIYYNKGITSSSHLLENGLQKGQEYIVRFKIRGGTQDAPTASYLTQGLTPFIRQYDDEGLHIKPKTNSKEYAIVEKMAGSENWIEYKLTITESVPRVQIRGEKIGLFFNASRRVWLEEVEFFPLAYGEDENGAPVKLEPGKFNIFSVEREEYLYYNATRNNASKITEVSFLWNSTMDWNNPDIVPAYSANFEKIRTLNIKESNRFNILQSIAELFEAWIVFDIEHNEKGEILYTPEGRPQKTVRLVEERGQDSGLDFVYGIDLQGLKRTYQSNEISTKTIVQPNIIALANKDVVSIVNSVENYSRASYILDLDYYVLQGMISAEELIKDLYSTQHGIGLYEILHNNFLGYQAITNELIARKNNLSQLKSAVETYEGLIHSTQDEIHRLKETLRQLAKKPTWEEAQSEIKILYSEPSIQSKIIALKELENNLRSYQLSRSQAESSQSFLNDEISDKELLAESFLETAHNAEVQFHNKYADFIQEGIWSDVNYFDDDRYYLDAKSIAHTSSKPQVSYEINALRLSMLEEFKSKQFQVGDIARIQDVEFLGMEWIEDIQTPVREKVLLSKITYYLDEPDKDVYTVQNYKTQFEDLFQRIVSNIQQLQINHTGAVANSNALTRNLGTLAWGERIEQAMLGDTIISGGFIQTEMIRIGSGTSFAPGYDPSTKETPSEAQAKADRAAFFARQDLATSLGYKDYEELATQAAAGQTLIIGGYIDSRMIRISGDGISEPGTKTFHEATAEERDSMAVSLGYTSYTQMMQSAASGETIIVGGSINTDLIKTGILQSRHGSTWINMENGFFHLGGITYDHNGLRIDFTGTNVEDKFDELEDQIENIELTPGPKGEPGTPAIQWTIGSDGYWYEDGVKTDRKAVGEDGSNADVWTIGANGNWYKNGVDTGKPSQGEKGDSVQIIKLTASHQIFTKSKTGAVTPNSLTVTGEGQNIAINTWTYSVNGGSFTSTVPTGVSRSGTTVTINGTAMAAKTIAIKAANDSVEDTLTVAKVEDGVDGATGADGKDGPKGDTGASGADAYTIVLSNESHTFPGSENAAVAGSTTIDVIAYKGASRIAATIGTISGQVTGLTASIDSASNGTTSAKITVAVTTSMTTANGVLTIPLTVDGKSFTKTFAYAVAFKGNKGDTGNTGASGQDAITILLSNESHTFAGNISNALASSTVVSIIAYKGATRVASTIGTITGQVDGLTTSIASNGTTSNTFTVSATTALKTANGVLTIPITVDGKSFTKNFSFAVSFKGATGSTGSTGNTGASGADAKVITLTASAQIFTKPKTGAVTPSTITVTGTTQNVTIATWQYSTNGGTFTTTLPTGVTRSGNVVTINGTTMNVKTIAVKAFNGAIQDTVTIAKVEDGIDGAKGDEGDQGVQGPAGSNGQSQYVHIRYSANANGSGFTTSPVTTTKYIGIAVTTSATAPTAASAYNPWSKYVGEDGVQGAQGIPGVKGDDGTTTYTWVKYADTPTSGMDDSAAGKKYIGLAFNKTTQTESTVYNDYQWSLMPQNIVVGGRNLILKSEVTTSFEDSVNTMTLSVPMLMDYIGSEMTLSFYIQSEDSTPTVKTYLMDYDDMTAVPNSMSEEFEVSTSPMRASYTFTLDDISEIEHLVLAFEKSSSSGFVSRWKVQLEYGDTMQDWRPAFEDLQADIDGKVSAEAVDTLEGNLTDLSTIVATKEELGSIYSNLLNYSELLAKAEIDTNQAKEDISALLQRVPVIENNLGEFVEKWSFIDSYITMGNEGLLIGAIDGSTMLRFTHDRIDFIDGDFDDPVAELTNQFLKINHGIFVVSAQIGEHRISTKTGGHTIVEWMGGGV